MTREAHRDKKGERIAKALARAGIASRREIERMIAAGRIRLDGRRLDSPAVLVESLDGILVDGQKVAAPEPARLWRCHKPSGLVTTHRDPGGRPTLFDRLPEHLPRVISVGRLDLNSEGLILLTNDGGLARWLEMPSTGWIRRYRVRAHGTVDEARLAALADGITVDGVVYEPIEARLESRTAHNCWLAMSLREGKNREIRRVLAALGLEVNRLIRVAYGPFTLGSLPRGAVAEVPKKALYGAAGGYFRDLAQAPARVGLPDQKAHDPSKWAKAKPKPKRPAARRRQQKPAP
ncbi:MAG: hypothetical protein Tsb008_16880 [Rhodothalassiaceae bacterium]